MRDDFLPEAHFAIAVEAVPATHEDYAALLVANAVIGSWNDHSYNRKTGSNALAQAVSSHHLAHKFVFCTPAPAPPTPNAFSSPTSVDCMYSLS